MRGDNINWNEEYFLTKRLFSVVTYWATLLSAFDLEPAFSELLHDNFSQSCLEMREMFRKA